MSEPVASDRGRVYAEFIFAELAREHERRASSQSRASALSGFGTGAVGLAGAGLVFAFGQNHALSLAAALLLLATLILFLVSTGLAAAVFAIGNEYKVSSVKGYSRMLNAGWEDSDELARRATATFAAKTLVTLRSGNNRSAIRLLWAGYLQVAGLATLIVALAIEFTRALT